VSLAMKVEPGRCATCRHWRRSRELNPPWMGICSCDKLDDERRNMPRDGLAYGCEEACGFYTGERFGCVHHEEDDDESD